MKIMNLGLINKLNYKKSPEAVRQLFFNITMFKNWDTE